MTDRPPFTIKVDQNPYLGAGGHEMHAVVTVESDGGAGPAAAAPRAAEVIIIDASGSMSYGGKMGAAKRAADAALRVIRDGVRFAVIAGANSPRMVYPAGGERTAVMDGRHRANAIAAVARLEASGGTAIGSWLRLADRLLTSGTDEAGEAAGAAEVRHAILLTDGKNQHETPEELDAALRACEGHFGCDARGVGTDWDVSELRKITSVLLGGFLDVPDPADLEDDFRRMTEDAMGKHVAALALRVWTPQNGRLRFVKQMVPTVEDLTDRRVDKGQIGDYPLGAWGAESREYHLCVDVPPGDVGRQGRAAWVKLVAPDAGEELAHANVLVEWTDDEALSTRINARVAHHTGQSELADAIQEGLAARRDGDDERATARLGRAVALAEQVGNSEISDLLGRMVDVDHENGTVRLKKDVAVADEMSLDTRSVRTVRTRQNDEASGTGA
ncbi:VWA domain-containing protein [Actinomadura gamaensis]|uniref:VWA domain-containing protein n=1 Tax=Actinomadura gamaensis TaxID=1763541 RepID=A0ABV9UA93_9ACTN